MLHLVSSLVNTDFDNVASMIQQSDPLHSFETARSRLLLEESRLANDPTARATSFVAATADSAGPRAPPPQHLPAPSGQPTSDRGCGRGHGGGRGGRNGRRRGRGGSCTHTPLHTQQQQSRGFLQQYSGSASSQVHKRGLRSKHGSSVSGPDPQCTIPQQPLPKGNPGPCHTLRQSPRMPLLRPT